MRFKQKIIIPLLVPTVVSGCSAVQSQRVESNPPNEPILDAPVPQLRALSDTMGAMNLLVQPVGAPDNVAVPTAPDIVKADEAAPGNVSLQTNPLRAGLTYFMPRQLLRFTVSKAEVKREKLIVEKAALEAEKKALDTRMAVITETVARTTTQLAAIGATSTLRAALQTEADRAAMDKVDVQRQIDAINGKIQTNSAAIAALSGKDEQLAFKVEALPMGPDPANHYVLNVQHSWLRDDNIKLTITPEGLLTSADIETTGRLGDILAEGATALGRVGVKLSTGAAGAPTVDCKTTTESITRIIDPIRSDQLKELNEQLIACGFAARVRYGSAAATAFGTSYVDGPKPKARTAARNGIYYRTAIPMTFEFEKYTEQGWISIKNFIASVPQAGPIAYIPSPASLFTKNKTVITFKDGMVTNWNSDQPSDLLEIMRTPGRIVDNLAASASQLVQLRVNAGTSELSEINKERELLIARDKMRRFRECLDKAVADGTDTAPCYNIGT